MTINQARQAYYMFGALRKISKQLHRLYKLACNVELTERQTKRMGRLEDEAEGLAQRIGLHAYHQRDPRGAAIWIVETLAGADTNYTRGFCV